MKTPELEDAALDYAVAMANNETYDDYRVEEDGLLHAKFCGAWLSHSYNPSTDWAQGGPIIERERLLIQPEIGKDGAGNAWSAIAISGFECFGPTTLIAAMRCYISSKLGDEVEIPEELI